MKLTIGLLSSSASLPAWLANLAEELSALPNVNLRLVHAAPAPQIRARAWEMYLSMERRLFRNLVDVDAPRKVEIPFSAETPDLLIAPNEFQPPHGATPRYGIWSWRGLSSAAGFEETYARAGLMECQVVSDGRLLRRAVFAADPYSAARSRARAHLKAASAMLWAVKALLLRGDSFLENAAPVESALPTPTPPRPWKLAAFFLKQIFRGLSKKFQRPEVWQIFAAQADGLLPRPATRRVLNPPPGAYWADPLTWIHNGQPFLFAEEFLYAAKRGRIVCLTLDEEMRVTSNQVALERPYHLSYPFVFEHEGETYMIPETASRRAIELYRCVEFPQRWEFVHEVMRDIYAVDATLLQHGGRWWLFANCMSAAGASSWDELHIFHADSPLATQWTPHALNPVLADARFARPAGRFFVHAGELYRPSQDSSRRYGYAINLNRVEILNEREYRETPAQKILPHAGILTTHTYSRAENWILTDGVKA